MWEDPRTMTAPALDWMKENALTMTYITFSSRSPASRTVLAGRTGTPARTG